MTRPLSGCANNIDLCSPNDQLIHDALSRNNEAHGGKAASKGVTPNGPTRLEVKKQEDGATSGVKSLVKHVAAHGDKRPLDEKIADKLLQKAVSEALKAVGAGTVSTVYKGVKKTTDVHIAATGWARDLGTKLDAALQRDAMNVSIAQLVHSKLSPGYVAQALKARPGAADLARGIYQQIERMPPERGLALVKSLQQSAADGVATARVRLIGSEGDLRAELDRDPAFAQRYETETAFRHGVRSALFEAQQ